jgi:phage terminase large subunit
MAVKIKIDPRIYNEAYYPYLYDTTRIQIFFGGSSSGKSYFLAQRTVEDILRGGRNYLICRNVGNTIRTSVFNEIVKAIGFFGVNSLFKINGSDLVITCVNGYQIIFKGLDDVQKIKSITPAKGVITDIWVEEAPETARTDIKDLRKRLRGTSPVPKRLILSLNPIYINHWIYKDFFAGHWGEDDKVYKDDHLLILKTTYKDNRFLMPDDIYELEHETDPYYYDVYTLGKWGTLGDLIFRNWRVEDLSARISDFPSGKHGLDFGFTNDPTAYTRSVRQTGHSKPILYILKEWYEYGVTNDFIAQTLSPMVGHDPIRCDSSEPKSIAELRQYGLSGAMAGIKGPGSVNFGIQWLKQHDIIIHKECQNTINEFSLYQWKKNKDGEAINEPVDKFNHSIDATRYAWSGVIYEELEAERRRREQKSKPMTKEELGFW